MKYLFLDVETTGIEPATCAIIQLSAIVEIDGIIKETINYKIKPHPEAIIHPEALAVSNTTMQDLDTYTPPYSIFQEFIQTLEKYVRPFDKKDKFFFLAYNAPFDVEFIRQFFIRNGSNYFSSYFWNPALDIMTLSLEYLKKERPVLSNFKLATVAKALDIKVDESKLHDALYDIMITRDIYHKLCGENKNSSEFKEKIIETSQKDPVVDNKVFFDGLF